VSSHSHSRRKEAGASPLHLLLARASTSLQYSSVSPEQLSAILAAIVIFITSSVIVWGVGPVWRVTASAQPTRFETGVPSNNNFPSYLIVATNIGSGSTSGPIKIEDTLPTGMTTSIDPAPCTEAGQTVTCESSPTVNPGEVISVLLRVDATALSEGAVVTNKVKISGGNAADAVTETTTTISSTPSPFEFLPGPNGLSASLTDPDGAPMSQAGDHPYQLTVDVGFPSQRLPGGLPGEETIKGAGGGLRNLITDLPHGVLGNPNASPVLCTEAELESDSCPDKSAVGVITVILPPSIGAPSPSQSPLYNMVAPGGTAAEFGFNAGEVGVFAHIDGGVRNDGDYGVSAATNDILARSVNPVLGGQAQLWGDPSDPSHDAMRGQCGGNLKPPTPCDVPKQDTAFLTMPSACANSLTIGASADSWLESGQFRSSSAQITGADPDPLEVEGCDKLEFKPTIEAKPTTNLIDSPSGLDFTMKIPQETKLGTLSTSTLKDITLTLPEGMTANTAQAAGLGACTPGQVGLTSAVGQTPVRFTKPAASCPNDAKLGTVEITTPLLGHTLEGSLYLAEPFTNPFGSLLAIYLTVDDRQSGVVAKLAGLVKTNPVTGQLSTTFTENPDLPLEEARVHLFDGPRAALRTPPACATYTTAAALTPWSSPKATGLADSFALTAAPGGGTCPASAQAAPHHPSFEAGTISPQAGAYSPFAMKLTREDGSQTASGLELTLPPGLVGKAAGIPYCSETQIAQARGREKPNQGALEQADPSCSAASQIGTVDVGAGAGITPYYASGNVYLAGPYKGAPLSAVVITPAVAGPFDLGAVVVRAALQVDPERAQVRTVSDPLPTILEGIPLDVRSVALALGRDQFTLNPTNCDPMSIDASVTSVFGQAAALSNRFQVGDCEALAYKPRYALSLKGQTKRTGHPALNVAFRPRPGQANSKRIAVTLPRSEFLDQAHIGTVCTRVQFAADQCPPRAIYGHATATTPLLDDPVSGPVYLRSSSHELPDLVLDLHGQVDAVVVGRIDSVKGGIRTTVESAPDVPVSKVVVQIRGGRKGILINSANLCKLASAETRATIKTEAQNGRRYDLKPVVKSACKTREHKKQRGT
jgi:hypothetical protein